MRILILALFISSTCFAKAPSSTAIEVPDPGPFSIDAGDEIEVSRYDAASRLFQVVTFHHPTVLPIFATPENLAAAVPILNLEILKEKPTAILGHQYQLDKDLLVKSD